MLDRLLIAVARHSSHIPQWCLRALFALAADITWVAGIGGVRQLERNLSHVLQTDDDTNERPDHHTLRRLSRAGMHSYFSYFVEALTVGACDHQRLLARIRGDGSGLESLTRLVHDAPGSAPLALGHQGNWDYAGLWAHGALAPVTTVAERLPNKELLDVFVTIREQLGMTILLTGQPGLTDRLKEAMDAPHVLVPLLADRDLSSHGEFVHAFGSFIRVARGPATLAYDKNLPLYVANIHRERLDGSRRKAAQSAYGYVIDISGPLPIDEYRTLPREQALRAITQAWVDVWARGIAAHPEDWHMLQPIFIEDLDLSRLHDVPEDVLAYIHAMKHRMPRSASPKRTDRHGHGKTAAI